MESVEGLDSDGVSSIGMGYCKDGYSNIQENENVGDIILDDFDLMMEDIDDRLIISRMVSESVIKGIVNAVSQEADEKDAAKELEIAALKETLCHPCVDCGGGSGASLFPRNQSEQKFQEQGKYPSHANGLVEPNNFEETLHLLSEVAKGQLEGLGKHIENQEVSACTYISSGPDMVSEFNSLKGTVETMFHQMRMIANVNDWKLEHEIREKVEVMVISTIFQSMQAEYDRCLLDVNGVLCLADRFKEISSIRHELSSIQKCLQEFQEIDHFHFHPKALSSHELPSGSLWDANSRYEESKSVIPEDFETSHLKHLNAKELYKHFRNEIMTMRREHESTVQKMTEQYFTLKRQVLKDREPLKEKGPFAPFRKDKDFEMLRNNVSKVISELDDVLVNKEKLSEFCNHSKSRLDAILWESLQFKDMVNNQKFKLNPLTLQASHATKELSQHSQVEEDLRKMVKQLESSIEDTQLEALISEEVYICILTENVAHANFNHEDSDMRSSIMQEIIAIIYEQAFHDADITVKSDYEDTSNLESTLSQQICEIAFEEMLRDLSVEMSNLREKILKENERLVSLEAKTLGIENELQMQIEENKNLKSQVSVLKNSIERKDKLLAEVNDAYQEKQLQLELVKEELSQLTVFKTELGSLISNRDKKVVLLKDQLAELQKHIGCYGIDSEKLNEKLKLSENKLREAGEEKAILILALDQERNNLAMLKVKDREHMKQMESMSRVFMGLSKLFADFQRSTTEIIHWHTDRLDNSAFQLHSLVPKINNLRRTRLLYKEKLDKRCSDLQKAETEVDVLGDEVDTLLSLLEKIYVALDHYSPILQHYPGITEILKLIKIELSRVYAKSR